MKFLPVLTSLLILCLVSRSESRVILLKTANALADAEGLASAVNAAADHDSVEKLADYLTENFVLDLCGNKINKTEILELNENSKTELAEFNIEDAHHGADGQSLIIKTSFEVGKKSVEIRITAEPNLELIGGYQISKIESRSKCGSVKVKSKPKKREAKIRKFYWNV